MKMNKTTNLTADKETNMSKSMRTGIIRYNITDNNRKYCGQPRNFNVPKVVSIINGNVVQELVSKGDMYGYLGHGVRLQYGLTPSEAEPAISADGKMQLMPIDPCLRTISIKAYDDGTIEHEAEFIDNHLGRTAWEWFNNKTGGFSSVFTPSAENPTNFFGFDYVRMPNFDNNRGYIVADSAMYCITNEQKQLSLKQRAALQMAKLEEREVIMDSLVQNYLNLQNQLVSEIYENQQLTSKLDNLRATYDSTQKDIAALKSSVDSLTYENSRLIMPQQHQPMLKVDVNSDAHQNTVMDALATGQKRYEPMMSINLNDHQDKNCKMHSVEKVSTQPKTAVRLNFNSEFQQNEAIMDSLQQAAEKLRQESRPADSVSKKLIYAVDNAARR